MHKTTTQRATAGQVLAWLLKAGPFLVLFWLLLSGHFEPLLLSLGAGSLVLVCWLSLRAGVAHAELADWSFPLRLPRYLLWLIKETLVSALAVVRQIWSPRGELRPVVGSAPSEGMSELSQAIYANSITLTPGTLSLYLADDHIDVHSLRQSGIDDLHEGTMRREVERLEA